MSNTTINPLETLVATLEKQNIEKRDMIVPAAKITYRDGQLWVQQKGFDDMVAYDATQTFHNQVSDKLGIPKKYYERMMVEYPALLEENINGWLSKGEATKYLLRTWEKTGDEANIVRAFLSNRYKLLDNYDVLFAALDAIKEMGIKDKIKITKAEVTEKRMYLHITCPEIEHDATDFLKNYLKDNDAVGNGIISGLVITNSEVGLGTFEVRPRAVIVKCANGLIAIDDRFKKIHLGGRMEEGEIVWSENTKQANYKLIMSQTKDAVKTYLSAEYLGKMVAKIAEANKIKLEFPYDTVQNVCKELSISDAHRKSILNYFMEDGDLKASGVFQAITREAQNMDADTQFEIESEVFMLLPKIGKFDKPFTKN